jgi:hypothetical protein
VPVSQANMRGLFHLLKLAMLGDAMEIFRSAVSRRASSRAIQALLPASNTLIPAVSLAGQRLLVACRLTCPCLVLMRVLMRRPIDLCR